MITKANIDGRTVEQATARVAPRHYHLADFTADPRILILAAMALVIGTAGAFAAWVLVKLIVLITNLVWFGRLDIVPIPMAQAGRTAWMVLAPALVGLLTRKDLLQIRATVTRAERERRAYFEPSLRARAQ